MAANVETMFYTRTKPWHGLGTMVEEAPTSREALEAAGLNWQVIQKNLVTDSGIVVPGFKANLRETDQQVLGVVSDRYKVVQNEEAFAFTDALLGEVLSGKLNDAPSGRLFRADLEFLQRCPSL